MTISTSTAGRVRAEMARLRQALDDLEMNEAPTVPNGYYHGSAKTGAVRRASMDLTRALADLRRRPGQED